MNRRVKPKRTKKMKVNKLIIFAGLICVCTAHADTVDYIDMQLDAQINELISRRDKLKADLESCEKNTRGFKIAGISTLTATGVGVVGNIKLAPEIEKQKILKGRGGGGYAGGAGAGGGHGLSHLSQEQKGEMMDDQFCSDTTFSCEDLKESNINCSRCS